MIENIFAIWSCDYWVEVRIS